MIESFFSSIVSFYSQATFLSIAAMVLVIVGVGMISVPLFVGQFVMFVAQSLWLVHSIKTHQPALMMQTVVLLIINLKAIQNWHRKGVGYAKVDSKQ